LDIGKEFARESGLTVVISGAKDIVTDGIRSAIVENGHAMMGKLSGTGCMAASLVAAFAAVCSDHVTSSTAALAAFGLQGEGSTKDFRAVFVPDGVNGRGRRSSSRRCNPASEGAVCLSHGIRTLRDNGPDTGGRALS